MLLIALILHKYLSYYTFPNRIPRAFPSRPETELVLERKGRGGA